MKYILLSGLSFIAVSVSAQDINSIFKKITNDSSLNKTISVLSKKNNTKGLSTTDIASGLKEALQVGAKTSVEKLSAVDGFLKDAAVKILLPPEAQKLERTLRAIGLSRQVDDAVTSMNRAAEDAAKSAAPIFVNAIKQITFQDALGILKGGDSAATKYLREKTSLDLSNQFKPVIQQSLAKVDATKYWETMVTSYNQLPLVKKVNSDLSVYVTERALAGIFHHVALEEQKIRKDPMAQTSDLLKKVFGK